MDMKMMLSTLWLVVMFNMAFADILSFMMEYSTGYTPEVQATQGLMLIAAIVLEIPIIMIFSVPGVEVWGKSVGKYHRRCNNHYICHHYCPVKSY